MDSRMHKAMELDALKALAASAESSAKTLEIVLARLDKIDEALAKTTPTNPKGR